MSLQVRNTYRDFYNNKYSPFSDSIKEIVDLFEMYDYNKCAKKTIEILKSLIPDISRVATECKNQFPQFEYYFDKIECCKKIFDQISKAIKQVELSHVRDDKIKELSHFSVLARDISKDSNARYVDNIIIDSNKTIDPIDFSGYRLYTKVALYYDGKLFKTLPISEKIITLDGDGKNTKIKLGFKKILLTEVIKN